MKPLWLCALCSVVITIVPLHLAAATASSQEVPVPGGTAALARALAIDPVPERGRFISEITRLAYDTDARNPVTVGFLNSLRAPLPRGRRLALPFDDGTFELVPVPLTVDIWSDAIFRRQLAPKELVAAIIADRQAALLCHGLAALDDETLQFFASHSSLLSRLYERSAPMFAVFSSSVRIRGNAAEPPGGTAATALWEAAVGERATRAERFLLALFEVNEGRLAYLYDIAGHLDPARRAFVLGSWIPDPATRLERFKQLATASISGFKDWHVRTLPYARATHDLATTLMRLAVENDGRPSPPASRAWWSRLFASNDLHDDASAPKAVDDQPFDAAWLAETIGGADIRQRGDRLDQLSFAQRRFGSTDTSSVFVATRAVPLYRMLILTLERMGVRRAEVYAAAARHAARLAAFDGSRGFTAHAQFQGAVSLVARMALVRTIDAAQAESLVESLSAVPLGPDGRYAGAIARWIADDLGRVIRMGNDAEAAVIRALAGGPSSDVQQTTRLTWEGQEYRLDLGFAERRRLERVRRKQEGLPIDVPLETARLARQLATDTLSLGTADAAAAQLTTLMADVVRHARGADWAPPGIGSAPELPEELRKAHDELVRAVRGKDTRRAGRVATQLADTADDLLARTLLSHTYALYVGDPDGTVLLAGDVSHRHDFGFGVKDGIMRVRAAWTLPRQDVSPNVPWHITGSLLGLDVALAPLALRRLNFDHLTHAPRLTSNERDTFAASVALINPYALTDADRDTIADAVVRGQARVAAFVDDHARFDEVADALRMDGAHRRALQWTLANEPERIPSMFTLSELLFLGNAGNLHAWGMSALATAGCLCTRLESPGRWWLLTGRPQLGIVATAIPDLNLHIAARLKELRVPAVLLRVVVSAAMQDFLDSVEPRDDSDWLTLARASRTATREKVEDYLASATADGPLVPVMRTSQP